MFSNHPDTPFRPIRTIRGTQPPREVFGRLRAPRHWTAPRMESVSTALSQAPPIHLSCDITCAFARMMSSVSSRRSHSAVSQRPRTLPKGFVSWPPAMLRMSPELAGSRWRSACSDLNEVPDPCGDRNSPTVRSLAGHQQGFLSNRFGDCFAQRGLDFPMVQIVKPLTQAELNVLGDDAHRAL